MNSLITFFLIFFSMNVFSADFKSDLKRITIGVPINLSATDPKDLIYVEEWEIYKSIYDTLMTLNGQQYFPNLASKWSFNSQKKTISFALKDGLKFFNGDPITAEDVAYSFKRLMVTDNNDELAISRCLKVKNFKLKTPDEKHPLINVDGKLTIVIGPTDCNEILLKDFSDTNYGIVSKKSVNNNFIISSEKNVSGAFRYDNSSSFVLRPNINNWRWGNKSDKQVEIIVQKIDPTDPFKNNQKIDMLRTSNKSVYDQALKNKMYSIMSLPMMSWYLTPSKINDSKIPWITIIKDINLNLNRKNLKAFENNIFETPADTFFPAEYNCDKKLINKVSKFLFKDRSLFSIELVEHKTGESKYFIDDLKIEIQKMGYKVDILTDSNAQNLKIPENTLRLYVRRQFLADGNLKVMNFVFSEMKSIPDPNGIIINELKKAESLDKSITSTILEKTCKNLFQYNHIPLAHRKTAFLANDKEYFKIFSRGTGNINLDNYLE